MRGSTKIKIVDTSTLFRAEQDQIHLIRDALASGDAHYISHAIGVVIRASGSQAPHLSVN